MTMHYSTNYGVYHNLNRTHSMVSAADKIAQICNAEIGANGFSDDRSRVQDVLDSHADAETQKSLGLHVDSYDFELEDDENA